MHIASLRRRRAAVGVLAIAAALCSAVLTTVPAHADTHAGDSLTITPLDDAHRGPTALDAVSSPHAVGSLTCPNPTDTFFSFLSLPGQEVQTINNGDNLFAVTGWIAAKPGSSTFVAGTTQLGDQVNTQLFASGWFRISDRTPSALGQFMDPSTTYSIGLVCGQTAAKPSLDANGTTSVVFASITTSNDWVADSGAERGTFTVGTPKATTSTTLTASATGQTVNLSAAVSPSTATGSVEFFDGATSVGTAALSGGAATKQLTNVSVGSHSYTAVYGGDTATSGSTSAAKTVDVIALAVPPVTSTVTVHLNAASSGSLSLTGATSVSLGTASQRADNSFAASGKLGSVVVTDSRPTKAAWSLSGQATPFTGSAGNLTGAALGWIPAVDAGATLPTGVATGATAPSLAVSQPLATAAASADPGLTTTKLNADLSFTAPAGSAAGDYTSQLQLTLI